MPFRKRIALILVLLLLLLLLPADTIPADKALDYQVAALVSDRGFNLALWEVGALTSKLKDLVVPAAHLDDAAARQLVLDYVLTARRIGELKGTITRVLSDPQQPDPERAIAAWQAELLRLRRRQAERRNVVEAILESQTATVLAEEGLTALGLLWPPLKFQFSEPPLYLIVSPRQKIALRKGVNLRADLSLTEREYTEAAVDSRLPDHVSLVEDIGGFGGAYPTMVIDNASLSWILSTIAHEWTHNYLAFRPLGWHYFDDSDTVTLNETVASIVGDEIGACVLETYYPQQMPAPRPSGSQVCPLRIPELVPPRFDFNGEMRRTRLQVDRLLAEGRVAEAEAFMEAQRQRFVAHGYALRKLNQAYFAFHGSYATAASAVDPIGPKMTSLRRASPSLRVFLETVSRFTRVEDLDRALAEIEG